MKIRIGLYGQNGHQIARRLQNHPDAELAAVAAFDPAVLAALPAGADASVKIYQTLAEMLENPSIDLISLCSPCRRDQATDALQCLTAGKHVYAEKPCAMTERDLDEIIATARRCGRIFHEMAGTAFENPYASMRQQIRDGVLGEIIQVFAQKSYPYFDGRPQDNDVDGGLVMQVGIHAVRLIEHVTGIKVTGVNVLTTRLGNPVPDGALRMAASYMLQLANGGVASIVANYLNQPGFGQWGNEHLRIFGSRGFMEAVDGGARTRLVIGGQDCGPVAETAVTKDYLDYYLDELLGRAAMPLSLEDELHPLRIVIRANEQDLNRG